jgi:hypothetical protein
VDQGTPIALPVNMRLVRQGDQASVVVRTAATSMIGRYSGPASLEVDQIEQRTAWSVLVRGTLHPVSADGVFVDPKPMLDDRHQWMRLEITSMTGRRFHGVMAPGGYSVDWELAG